MKKVKKWFKENGFVGFGALVVAGVAIFMGWWVVSNVVIAFFLGMNWQIINRLWIEKYKDKVEDLVDDVKDKIGK